MSGVARIRRWRRNSAAESRTLDQGQANTVSMTTMPPISKPRSTARMIIAGSKAFGNAWRHGTRAAC